MLALVLMEFIIRFFARVRKFVAKFKYAFYILMIFLQICVMFSRVILGMHSLNQVLLGCIIGCYTLVCYYLFMERLITRWVLSIFRSQKSLTTLYTLIIITVCSIAI